MQKFQSHNILLGPFIDEENLENPELRAQSRCGIPKWRPQSEKKSTDPLGRKSYLWCSDMISSWRYSTSLFMWSSSVDGESWNPLLPPLFFLPPSLMQPLSSLCFTLLLLHSLTSLPPHLLFLSSPSTSPPCDFQGVSRGLSVLGTVRAASALPH